MTEERKDLEYQGVFLAHLRSPSARLNKCDTHIRTALTSTAKDRLDPAKCKVMSKVVRFQNGRLGRWWDTDQVIFHDQ